MMSARGDLASRASDPCKRLFHFDGRRLLRRECLLKLDKQSSLGGLACRVDAFWLWRR